MAREVEHRIEFPYGGAAQYSAMWVVSSELQPF